MINTYANRRNIYQLRELAIALTFCGGYIDAYAFMERGNTMAAGQTGNIIFLGMDIANHDVPGILAKVLSLIAFIIGTALAVWIGKKYKAHYWRIYCVIPLIVFCFLTGFLPESVPSAVTVPPLSFGLAMQCAAFDKIEGQAYNNIFSTGNLKKSVTLWVNYWFDKDSLVREQALTYLLLVAGFAGGAVFSAVCDSYLGEHTIWIASVMLIILMLFYLFLIKKRERLAKASN